MTTVPILQPTDDVPTILVIDDDESVRRALVRVLTRAGYDVVDFTCADAALDHLYSDRVDMVISDYQMPGRTGTDILRTARLVQPHAPRILLTGRLDNEVAEEVSVDGDAQVVLTKPWSMEVLLRHVRDALDHHGA